MLDPHYLYLAAKQPSREPNLELACDSSRQISSLLHCSCSQAVFSLIMCDPNTLHVCCDLGAKQLLCYCYFGAKQLLCLWLFGRQTISIFIVMCGIKQLQGLRLFVSQTTFIIMIIWEPNNLSLEAKQPSREPQVEPSCASSRQISSLLHGSWSPAASVSKIMCDPNNLCCFCDLGAKQPLFVWLFRAKPSLFYGFLEPKPPLFFMIVLEPKPLLCLWLFWSQSHLFFVMVSLEPNHFYVYN